MKLILETDKQLVRCDECALKGTKCHNSCGAGNGAFQIITPSAVPPKLQTEYEWKLERYTLLKAHPRPVLSPGGSVNPLSVEQEGLEKWLEASQPPKPCPFCGGDAFVKPATAAGFYTVGCSDMACVCCFSDTRWNASSRTLAIRKWDKREAVK